MKEFNKDQHRVSNKRWTLIGLAVISVLALGIFIGSFINSSTTDPHQQDSTLHDEYKGDIVNGIHVPTGLKDDDGLMTVVAHCTACHSAQLIIQNRMNKERWNATIRWMQDTQNLWDLGDNQEVIVDYLIKNYPLQKKGRRENLDPVEWYELSE